MSYLTKFFLILIFGLLFGPVFTSLSQETLPAKVTEMVNLDENILPKDLEVGSPRLLPDSPFYFLKNWQRAIRSFFAFNLITKAKLKLKFANEKLMELKKLAEIEKEKIGILREALENFEKEENRLKEIAEKIKEKIENPKVEKFLEKFIDHSLKYQKLFDKFEKELPSEIQEKLSKIKEESLLKFSEINLKFAKPEILEKKLEKILPAQKGSDFKHFKNLEVLKRVMEKVPERAKPAIERAMENSLKRLKKVLEEMKKPEREKFKEYLTLLGGNEIEHLAILDELEIEELTDETREEIEKAKEKVLEKIEKKLKEYKEKKLEKAQEKFLENLKKGRIEDLRIIKELENNLSSEVLDKILEIKNKTKEKLIEDLEKIKSPEEQKKFFEKIEKKFHDLKQLEVFKEIEDLISPEKEEFFEKLKEKAIEKMKEKIKNAKDEKERLKRLRMIAGNRLEHLEIFEEFNLPKEILKETIEKFSRKAQFIEDPEKLEFLKRKIEKEKIKEIIEKVKPEFLEKIKERRKDWIKKIDEKKAKEQIEKAKEAILSCENSLAKLPEELKEKGKKACLVLIQTTKEHLEKALLAFEAKDYGKAFGQATAALQEALNCQRIVDRILTKCIKGKCLIPKYPEEPPSLPHPVPKYPEKPTSLPNPASVYCQKLGYKLEIRTNPDGSQYGVCIFPDGTECEEWAFFRGECKPEKRTTKEKTIKPEPVCIQVITPAISPEGICKEFPTPCDVPEGWKKVEKCPEESLSIY
jgi:putative hemolysin